MAVRVQLRILMWPDPVMQEQLEATGFFMDPASGCWMRFANQDETRDLVEYLKRCRLAHEVKPARGKGRLTRYPRLTTKATDGGAPTRCGYCGKDNVFCRQWVEGDDTDSIDYPNPARLYLCGQCVQHVMQPHPRMYVPAEDKL